MVQKMSDCILQYRKRKAAITSPEGGDQMNELDVEHRLTEVEQRAKSNSHRLEELEPVVKEIHIMSNTMIQLVEEVKHTNETVASLDKKVDKMDSRWMRWRVPRKRVERCKTNTI